MQKVIYKSQAGEYAEYLEDRMISYIKEGQIETFEGFMEFDLMAFDWYDIRSDDTEVSQILIYIDREDFFVLCEDSRSYEHVKGYIKDGHSNERALYFFFVELIKNDMGRLDKLEAKITETEDAALNASQMSYLEDIREYRKELFRIKRYYEQLAVIFDNLTANDNDLFSKQGVRYFSILGNRVDRLYTSVLNLRDYVTQMREACQSQIDLEQNIIMRTFTVIAAVFLPLTLIVGWYGMNFKYMPELTWEYGYPAVILLSVAVCVGLLIWFKRKKWF